MLDRVIRFCAGQSISFIWIDQECILQDNAEDKQVGILSMDLVYQWAEQSVGVLEVCVTEQRHVKSLETLMDAELPGIERQPLLDIIEVLELIATDPWFTRAWCLQESTSGSRKMLLLLRHNAGLQVPETLDYGGNIALNLAQLNNIVSSLLVYELDRLRAADTDTAKLGDRFIDWWFARTVPNVYAESERRDLNSHVQWSGAEAMWFLEKRSNSILSDRLGIMANLCEYEMRLLQAKETEMDRSFSIAALTLMILNGDMSVLTGHYEPKSGRSKKRASFPSDPPTARGHGFTWCPPRNASLADSAFIDKDELVLRIDVLSFSAEGLWVRGCKWIADIELDLTCIESRLGDRFDHSQLAETLQLDNGFDVLLGKAIGENEVSVVAMTELICHLFVLGFRPLARQIWNRLRARASRAQLAASDEVKAYDSAALEFVIDVENRKHKWKNPVLKLLNHTSSALRRAARAASEDSFTSLQSDFAQMLLTAVIERGSLVIARPECKDAVPGEYRGVFEAVQIGDLLFTPRTNFGCETPYEQYSWHPMTWRLQAVVHGDTSECRGLVSGDWSFEEDCMSELYLV